MLLKSKMSRGHFASGSNSCGGNRIGRGGSEGYEIVIVLSGSYFLRTRYEKCTQNAGPISQFLTAVSIFPTFFDTCEIYLRSLQETLARERYRWLRLH